ncbi:MAG TPA: hypothetical protein VF899_10440 [Pyrinomonadaceae bacterium]
MTLLAQEKPAVNSRPKGKVEPRWPALVALLGAAALYAALPTSLIFGGPRWLLLAGVLLLLIPAEIAHRRGNHSLNQSIGYILNGIITVAMIASIFLLIAALPQHRVNPGQLLRSAAALWGTNIIIFASWYWRLDAGGPHARSQTLGHIDGAFLFPQMTMDPAAKIAAGEHEWEPNFVDYLFLAFNTSTALSPTDVPVLSRWAKSLMMTQALISLLVIVLLAARAVNLL